MAENEYLDIGKSHRWRRVYDAVRDERPIDQIICLFGVCLRKAIKVIREPLFEGGPPQIPLGDLLNAFERGPEAVDRVVRRCRGHDFAVLFQDAIYGATSRKEAMEQFFSAVCEKICDQIEHKIACPDGQRTFGRIRSTLDKVEEGLKPEISRLAGQLAADPGSRLTRPKSEHVLVADTRSILSESLLGLGNA
jgi:hypothetical protein